MNYDSQSLRSHYVSRGYVILKEFFSPHQVGIIKAEITKLAATPKFSDKPLLYVEKVSGVDVPLRLEWFLEEAPELSSLIDKTNLIKIVEEISGKKLILFKDKVIYKNPGTSGFSPHQDANLGWADLVNSSFVNVFLGIDECNSSNGPLEVVPGSHANGRIGEKWVLLKEDLNDNLSYTSLLTDPGDVIVFDAWLVHKSSPNSSDRSRNAIYLSYSEANLGSKRDEYFKFLPNIRRKFVMNKVKNSVKS